jgi:hypothetical protein
MSSSRFTERDRIEQADLLLAELQRQVATSVARSALSAGRVGRLIRVFGLAMAMLGLSNLYFVNDLTQEVRLVIRGMNEMTGYFVDVSERMGEMRRAVVDMESDVSLLPVMDAQMTEIAAHVGAMGWGVAEMQRSTEVMDRELARQRLIVGEMAVRFRMLNASVGTMGVNVREMAKPVP